MTVSTDDYAWLAKDSYKEHRIQDEVRLNGHTYRVLDEVTKSPTGFQATAYQRTDTGEVVIAYRGTEANKDHGRDDKTDLIMVRDRTNNQLPEALAFTEKARAEAQATSPQFGHPIDITVTGHSLGGALAEINAAKFKMGGETFNAYGAAAPDLSYGVPEGVPKDAPNVIGHVRATDVVSAGSRHYGSTVVYATKEDIESMEAGRYLDKPNPAHPTDPFLSASVAAHFVDNFAPDPGKGPGVMTKENEERYQHYKGAIDHYRNDVLTSRIDLTDVLNHKSTPAQATRLSNTIEDAASVAAYKVGVHKAEGMLGVPIAEQGLHLASSNAHFAGQAAQTTADVTAHGIQAGGQAAQSQAERVSRGAHAVGEAAQAASNDVSRTASAFAEIDPVGALGVSLGARAAGYVMHAEAESISKGAHLAGEATHAVTESVSHGLHSAGQSAHTAAETVSQTTRDAEQTIERLAAKAASTQAHDAMQDKLVHGAQVVGNAANKVEHSLGFDSPAHPGHEMYGQIHSYIRKIDSDLGRKSDQHSANLAGALTVAAKEQGLTRADRVAPNNDGSHFFVQQDIVPRAVTQTAHAETAQAVKTPVEQSSQQFMQTQAQTNSLAHTQAQRMEQTQNQQQQRQQQPQGQQAPQGPQLTR